MEASPNEVQYTLYLLPKQVYVDVFHLNDKYILSTIFAYSSLSRPFITLRMKTIGGPFHFMKVKSYKLNALKKDYAYHYFLKGMSKDLYTNSTENPSACQFKSYLCYSQQCRSMVSLSNDFRQ